MPRTFLGEQRGGWEKCQLGWLQEETCDCCERPLEKGVVYWLEMEQDLIFCPDCFDREWRGVGEGDE